MAFPATHPGTCQRCKGAISPGDRINIRNRPFTGARFHETCPGALPAPEASPEVPTPAAPEAPAAPAATVPASPVITPAAAPGSIDAMIEARVREILGTFKPETAVDVETVRQIVREALDASPVTRIVLTRQDGSEVTIPEGEHYNFARLLRLYNAGIRAVYIWGPAGTGKTTAATRAAAALGLNWEMEGLDGSSPRSALFGYRTPEGEPVLTPFLRTFTDPKGGLVIDELDGSPGTLQVNLNSALANGHVGTAWGKVERGEGFGLWGTGNGPGRPTPAHPERKNMAGAFKDRLYFMYWPLDKNIERRACGRSLVKVPARKGSVRDVSPEAWGRWIEEIRDWTEKNCPAQIHVSTRAVIEGLKALAAGETPEEVADGLIFKGADDSMVAKALAACPLPGAV
jgi:MoxR-like ATPase